MEPKTFLVFENVPKQKNKAQRSRFQWKMVIRILGYSGAKTNILENKVLVKNL